MFYQVTFFVPIIKAMFLKQANWLFDAASRYHAAVITAVTDGGNKYNLSMVRTKELLAGT